MKQWLLATVPLLFVGLLMYYLGQRSPDLRYQLSSPILINASGNEAARSVQQLEVVNNGNAATQNIQVLLRKHIVDLTVVQNSAADKYHRYDTASGTEVVYENLPPEGKFKYSFTTSGGTLTDQDIEVKHSQGAGKPALASTTSIWSMAWSSLMMPLMFYYFWLTANAWVSRSLRSSSSHDPLAVLRRKKPLMLTNSTWQSIRTDALENAYTRSWYEELSSSEGFRFLNSDQPKYLTDEEWHKLLNRLSDRFIKEVNSVMNHSRTYGDAKALRNLMSLNKPAHFSNEKWSQFVEPLSRDYINCLVDSLRWDTAPELAKALQQSKPDAVRETDWERYTGDLRKRYLTTVLEELGTSVQPMIEITEMDLGVLPPGGEKAVREFAYEKEMEGLPDVNSISGAKQFLEGGRPAWMTEKDYGALGKKARRCLKTDADERRYDRLTSALVGMLDGIPIGNNAPDGISVEEWHKLKAIEERTVIIAVKNAQRASELAEKEAHVDGLKSKVVRQLEVINDFLADAAVLDRLEEYENVFAPGNLANLRALANLRRGG